MKKVFNAVVEFHQPTKQLFTVPAETTQEAEEKIREALKIFPNVNIESIYESDTPFPFAGSEEDLQEMTEEEDESNVVRLSDIKYIH